jgi:hypothetical protein
MERVSLEANWYLLSVTDKVSEAALMNVDEANRIESRKIRRTKFVDIISQQK